MSDKYTLNKQDGIRILRGAGYAIGGALVTFLLAELPNIDFGQYTIVIVPIMSVLLNAGVKFFKGE